MAYFQRLVFALLLVFASWLPTTSEASFPAVSGGTEYANTAWSGISGQWFSSVSAACQASATFSGFTLASISGTNCNWAGGFGSSPLTSRLVASSCPANATVSNSLCTCNTGYIQASTNDSCISNAVANLAKAQGTADALNQSGVPLFVNGKDASLKVCYGGMQLDASGASFAPSGSYTEVYGPFKPSGGLGTPCTDTGSLTNPTGLNCPEGQFSGTVNGVQVCSPPAVRNSIAAGPSGTVTPTPTTTTGTSSSSSPQVSSDAPPGAASYKDVTTCNGGTCSTVRTFSDSAGVTLATKTTTDTLPDFCSSNPKSIACVSSSFSASQCGSAPACSGDAVQCATALYVFQTSCALQAPSASPEIDAYNAAKLNAGGDQSASLQGNSSFSFGAGSFDQTELLGTPSGISDLSVTVMGRSLVLNFSLLNVWLSRLGFLLQAITFLLCARIVIRG
jgi:hypothetical protein